MKRIDVGRLLGGAISPEDFSGDYRDEVAHYVSASQKTGSVIPIYLTGEGSIFVDEGGVDLLMNYVRHGRLNKELAMYVLDALSLDDGIVFSSPNLREAVMDWADSGLDG